MLTPQQIDTYHEQGFIVVENVFDSATLLEMRTVLADWIRGARVTRHTDVYDLEPDHTPQSPKVRRIKQPHSLNPVFAEGVKSAKLLAILKQLLGPNIRLQNSKLNVKAPGYGSPVEWHQDWAFYPHTNEDVLAVGVMIEDVRMDNGPMMVIPGSHKGPLYNHHAEGRFCGAMDPSECDIDFSTAVPCVGSAGTVTLHQARLVHGSAQNTSSHPRPFLLYECMAADAWPLMGVPDLNEFDSRIICGAPTLQPRLAGGIPVRMPLPAALNQGSIYENQTAIKNRYFGDKIARPLEQAASR